MASLQELLTIQAGDPLSKVERGEEESSAYFSQYERRKDAIEEINEAIKNAQEAASKKKGLFGAGGSLLGTLMAIGMNMALPGMGAVGQRLLQGAMSGLASGAAEKHRQDKYNPLAQLKALQEKYKGKKEGKQLEGTIESLESGL